VKVLHASLPPLASLAMPHRLPRLQGPPEGTESIAPINFIINNVVQSLG
jgi:hypothetical protein